MVESAHCRLAALCSHVTGRPHARAAAAELETGVVTAAGEELRQAFGSGVRLSEFLGESDIGVRVDGIDLSTTMNKPQVDAIMRAIGAYKIVCFSGQDVDDVSALTSAVDRVLGPLR